MSEKNHGLHNRGGGGRREVGAGTLLLDNDENNVTTDKVLSYFGV